MYIVQGSRFCVLFFEICTTSLFSPSPLWSANFKIKQAQNLSCQNILHQCAGLKVFLGSMLCVLCFQICIIPSGVQISKQNTHWTFDPINNFTPVYSLGPFCFYGPFSKESWKHVKSFDQSPLPTQIHSTMTAVHIALQQIVPGQFRCYMQLARLANRVAPRW